MNFKEYQVESKRTLAELDDYRLNLAHMCLGISSEYSELVEAISKSDPINISEEVADIIWYLSNYYTLRNYDLQSVSAAYIGIGDTNMIDIGMIMLDMCYHVSKLSDIVKKKIIYDRDIEVSAEIDHLFSINSALGALTFKYSINVEQALQNNIDKLKVRFPDAFTQDAANTRDLESEHKELSK